jgi:NADH-quinone oxidoreductase subunit L
MMLVVTFVSLMVHIYTIGYMARRDGRRAAGTHYQRFFSYISLFTFSMLMLVMSNNFVQLFFGWEAVGLVSYLLIGFWSVPDGDLRQPQGLPGQSRRRLRLPARYRPDRRLRRQPRLRRSVRQGKELATITEAVTGWPLITAVCICLFIGAMGKSAQFPLHVWLPDSMEGPTPISALIHAATMVTAGIFMVSRMSPLFELSDTALSFVIVIGAITTLFMALIAIVQTDIKRVVAYSTLSQLGYMTMALGASAYSVAIFHLMTHAFFKAVLFLGAGSVIIAMHHEQDMRKMGGLRKYMPITYITMLIAAIANAGLPPFAGFFSKDSIIEAVHLAKVPGRRLRLLSAPWLRSSSAACIPSA